MSEIELAPGIMSFSNVFADYKDLPSMIEDSVSYGAISWTSASVSGGTNKAVRDTDTIVVSQHSQNQPPETALETFNAEMRNIIFSIFKPSVERYMPLYNVNYSIYEEFNILKYGVGQKFTNHIDDHPNYHRRISLVYYINDDYLGGEINFPRFGVRHKPKANELLIFPSGYTYNHSIDPVTSGTRYSIVGWIK